MTLAHVTRTTLEDTFYHLPDHEGPVELKGMSVTTALKELRDIDFGSLGGAHDIQLSDGSYLSVELQPASDGGYLMSSQYIRRWVSDRGDEKTVRKYLL